MITCANLFSDENGGSIGKSAEKGDDQSFQGTEDGDSSDSLLALTTENYIDQHISDTDKYFITDDRETFFQVLFYIDLTPAKMSGKLQDIRDSLIQNADDQNQDIYDTRHNSSDGSSCCTHFRKTELSENEQVVEETVSDNGSDTTVERNLHLFDGTEQSTGSHCDDLKRIGKSDDTQIRNPDFLDLRLVRVHTHDKFRCEDGKTGEKNTYRHHEKQCHSIGTGDAVMIPGSPVLREKQHTAADKSPVSCKHQAGKLCTQTNGSHSLFTDRSKHDRIHHTACCGKQVLKCYRYCDDRNVL